MSAKASETQAEPGTFHAVPSELASALKSVRLEARDGVRICLASKKRVESGLSAS